MNGHNEPLLDNAEFNNITLEETEEVALASDLWNSELEVIFLSKKGVPSERKIKSNASASRFLTSSEIIQVKREKEELKEQKAKASEERKVRAQERKLKAEQKKLAMLAKREAKK